MFAYIKLSNHRGFEEDKLIWLDSMHGQYSVKNIYNLMLNISRKLDTLTQQED
jgi:hypothetical protein